MESEAVDIKLPKTKMLVIDNMRYSSSHDFYLTKEDEDKAGRELKENDVEKENCLLKLKDMLESTENMRCRTDNPYLLRYLRWTKYDCAKAYTAIKKLYTLRNEHPELFVLPSNLRILMNSSLATYLPYTDEKGRIIFWVDFRKYNLDELSIKSICILLNALADIITMNPHVQVNGIVGIWDFRGISTRHISVIKEQMTLRLMLSLLTDCYPWRVQNILGIHSSQLIKGAYSVLGLFLKKKIRDRVKLLGSDVTELHQYVSPAVLPKEYGGTLDENECSVTDFVIGNIPYLKYERSFGF